MPYESPLPQININHLFFFVELQTYELYVGGIGVARGGTKGGHGTPKCIAYFVVLCFLAVFQTKYCCSLKVKVFSPCPTFGLPTPLIREIN